MSLKKLLHHPNQCWDQHSWWYLEVSLWYLVGTTHIEGGLRTTKAALAKLLWGGRGGRKFSLPVMCIVRSGLKHRESFFFLGFLRSHRNQPSGAIQRSRGGIDEFLIIFQDAYLITHFWVWTCHSDLSKAIIVKVLLRVAIDTRVAMVNIEDAD